MILSYNTNKSSTIQLQHTFHIMEACYAVIRPNVSPPSSFYTFSPHSYLHHFLEKFHQIFITIKILAIPNLLISIAYQDMAVGLNLHPTSITLSSILLVRRFILEVSLQINHSCPYSEHHSNVFWIL